MSDITVSSGQGRIYVANEYPTFARTMSMVGQKLTFSRQITLNVRKICLFDEKHANFRVKHTTSWIFQHPTVGSQNINTLHVGW